MTNKHSPAPWEAVNVGYSELDELGELIEGAIEDVNGASVCYLNFEGCGNTEDGPARANLALIAAAPDLLEAVKELADVSRSYIEHMDADDLAVVEAARAAIAKAEGK